MNLIFQQKVKTQSERCKTNRVVVKGDISNFDLNLLSARSLDGTEMIQEAFVKQNGDSPTTGRSIPGLYWEMNLAMWLVNQWENFGKSDHTLKF